MKKHHIISIMLIAFLLVGCGAPAGSNNYITPQQISEPKIAEITPTFETQIERVNNCDGTNPTYNVSYKTIEAQKATFEVSVGAGGLVTGTPIPSVLEVQLEAKITAALAKDYGLTTEKNHDLTLENVQGTFLEHTITWKVTRVKGLIEVIYGDGIAQVGFDKIANVELYNRTSKPLGCDGSVNVPPTSINLGETPIATLETVPPPTQAPNVVMSETKLLGQWLYQQPRAPMPAPAGANQVIFAHGDINNTGTCRVKEFKTGETVQGLGLGSFKLWLITGTPEYIKDVEAQLQSGAAAHAGTDCPYLP
ncbi:MAG: hypothetical protein HFACDABA_03245 [Anaerolineales bacterium]|nr:hypothetical protein [Anaerolineales bacterium]